MRLKVGIIGGTGIGERLLAEGGKTLVVPTPEGMAKGKLVNFGGTDVFLLGRHAAGHKVPPHKVNYRAMTLAMKQLGITNVLSTAAVGSLREDWNTGTFVACSDFFDFSFRNPTLFDREVVHTDFSHPFGERGRAALLGAGSTLGYTVHPKGIYLIGNGPRYETPEEIQLYRRLGAELVGMTATTEAILMREAGIDYACLAVVTNLAAGISPTPLNHEEVADAMKLHGEQAVEILRLAVKTLAS
ncbi:MAG: MTAP family purine nucleoside phosphorylase [Armatimonadetes bacterium]|nr:MTAP family purine nucleoside phosphorylase [Armatimonadota bacterium]